MNGKFILAALEVISNLGYGTAALMDAMTSGYAESYRKLIRLQHWTPPEKSIFEEIFSEFQDRSLKKRRFYDVIHRLKRDGLITAGSSRGWKITKAGSEKLAFLKRREIQKPRYRSEKGNQLVIVAFDVPEKERRKRIWLRFALKNLGLRMLQRSVWIGTVILPDEFIADLEERNLLRHVEILAVTKSGTVRQVTS